MAGRKIRDEQDARRCIAAAKAEGVGQTEWARQHGIDGRSLFGWSNALAKRARKGRGKPTRKKESLAVPRLVELVAGTAHPGGRYVIRYGPLSLEVDDHFDEGTVSRLLRVIEGC